MRICLAIVVALGVLLPASARAEDFPPYLVLRAPAKPKHHHDNQGYYPGRAYAVETNAYNYGWFGAQYGKTCTRSFGTARNYTQWKSY